MEPAKLPPVKDLRPPRPKDAVQSLERGLDIILAFDGYRTRTLSQLVEKTRLSRSAVRRLLMTLVDLGYVIAKERHYQLAPSVLWLGHVIYQHVTMSDICKPHLQLLAHTLETSASVAVLEGDSVRYLCRIMDASRFAPTIAEGTRLPAHQTSLGRVLLAHQDSDTFNLYLRTARFDDAAWVKRFIQEIETTHSRGWSAVNQLMESGIQAVAVPLRNQDGTVVAAISAATHGASSSIQEFIKNSLPAVQETAARISRELRPETLIM